jgi:tetratricopeptide (TPR) repeat protein
VKDKNPSANTYLFVFLYIKFREELLPANHADLAASLKSLGLDYYCSCNFDEASDYFNRALTIEIAIHGSERGHTNISKTLGHLALIHEVRGDRHLASDHLMRALKIEQEILLLQHHYIGCRYEDIASLYASNNDKELAFLYYCHVLSILERILPVQNARYLHTTQSLITILHNLVENCCSNNDKRAARISFDAKKSENIHYLQEGLDILDQCQLLTQSATARTAASRLHEQLKQNDQTNDQD